MTTYRSTPIWLVTCLALLGTVACGDPSGPQTSSSSNWLRCATDAQCDNVGLAATCAPDGYCSSSDTGKRLEQTLVFQDEFDKGQLDSENFRYETGYSVRNGDAETYTSRAQNVSFVDGELVLTARAEQFGSASFTSGSVETAGLKAWKYGRIEVTLLAPDGTGTAPAIWLLPTNPGKDFIVCESATDCTTGSWPAWGDIVLMTVRSEKPNDVLHTASYAKEDATLGTLTRGQGGGTTHLGASVAAGYHDYAVDWGPQRIDW